MKAFLLMLVAVFLTVVLTPFALVVQVVRHIVTSRKLTDLWWDVAIGLDQLGGAVLYGEPDWTVSSRTYWLAQRGNRYAAMFERLINTFFGQGHCRESYLTEFNVGGNP